MPRRAYADHSWPRCPTIADRRAPTIHGRDVPQPQTGVLRPFKAANRQGPFMAATTSPCAA